MQLNRVLEQHIAVFGESGSGKTVMVSSFYGAAQEPQFLKSSLFDVTADDAGQGHRLHKNYLGMRDSARLPEPTRFAAVPYAFSVKLRDRSAEANSAKQFDAVRLVWHDYPGEWFEQDVSGTDEAQRRVDTFRSLLGSDVAFLLVDGQRLLDNAGEEERYLRSLLTSFRTGLVRLEDQLLEDGKPLVRFPRIWVLALSKADLLPELDVFGFRDLVIGKASEDLAELRKDLGRFVDSPDALAVGEDFVLLSSAKFEPNNIEVSERIGLDLILPLAAMLPFERHIRWVEQKQIATKVVEDLLGGAGALATALIGRAKFGGPKGRLLALVGRQAVNAAMSAASQLGGDQLRKMHADALAKKDYMAAVLTRFQLDLDNAEEKRVLLRSRR
ncbi:MAG: TRAFAC clade GTPase domain-containing protein [Acidimicrobiales bacterium]